LNTDFLPWSRTGSCGYGRQMQHAILRHGARPFFSLAYGEEGGEVLDQTTGTKVGRCTTL